MEKGSVAVMQLLLDSGIDVNQSMSFCAVNALILLDNSMYSYVARIESMNDDGACEVRNCANGELAKTSRGDIKSLNSTALMLAADFGFVEGVELLLTTGAEVNRKDRVSVFYIKAVMYFIYLCFFVCNRMVALL